MKLASIFSNGMVLQRNMWIPVWGKARPRAVVLVSLGDTCSGTVSSSDGEFFLRLPPMSGGGPYDLIVEERDFAHQQICRNVMIGEVWLASGQSNMEYRLEENPLQLKEFIAANDHPESLRVFHVERDFSGSKTRDVISRWEESSADNCRKMSAVALWHGLRLRQELGVPVGILSVSFGGSCINAWCSRSALMGIDSMPALLNLADSQRADVKYWKSLDANDVQSEMEISFDRFTVRDRGNEGLVKGWSDPIFDDSDWKQFIVPGLWTSQSICDNGAVWCRRWVELPAAWSGQELELLCGGIDKHDITYFNGVEIGRTGKEFESEYWNRHRCYRIPSELFHTGRNLIAIRNYSFAFDGGFNGDPEDYLVRIASSPKDYILISGKWLVQCEYSIGPRKDAERNCDGLPLSGAGYRNTPSGLFDSMISPLIPYALRGVIWYQGEADARYMNDAVMYKKKLFKMIQDWRYRWELGDFPFLVVQLAKNRLESCYEANSKWAVVRDAQRMIAEEMDYVVVVPSLDLSDGFIHPEDKCGVGTRLGEVAAIMTSSCPRRFSYAPTFDGLRCENSKIRLFFRNASGLHCRDDVIRGFMVSDLSKSFVPANAVLDGDSIVVYATGVSNPVAVRYGWADHPDCNLLNHKGLPVLPFRSDSWGGG